MSPDNPASHSDPDIEPASPGILVIYGATGDLTWRKLIPALYNLARDGLMPERFAVVGVARSEISDEDFRDRLDDGLKHHLGDAFDQNLCAWLMKRTYYLQGNVKDRDFYRALGPRLEQLHQERDTGGNEIHYLALPPSFFGDLVERLCTSQVIARDREARQRVVIEKPFGHNLESARELDRRLTAHLEESQIYRIDHYLGKETVQNLLVLRFGNAIFEPIWNRNYVDQVQITVAEDLGVERRGAYYDRAGALRDMVPNHLMQLLSFIAMEPPTSFEAEAVRNAKAEVLKAVIPYAPEKIADNAVRGQYGPGRVEREGAAPAYRDEEGVDGASSTETFAALRLGLDNWRWAGVPFYLRTGKRMPQRQTEILIGFRRVPSILFRGVAAQAPTPNRLLIRIQPREAIFLQFQAKRPGPAVRVADAELEFCWRDYFGLAPMTGYETLLYDAIRGDATLFQRADSIEEGWRIIDPVLQAWETCEAPDFPNYPAGSWGPAAADDLLAGHGHAWRNED